MSRAENTALNAYPHDYPERTGYREGYEEAEKDLSLTWEDMQKIYKIICETDAELDSLSYYRLGYQEYWEEVLRRFNKAKEG